jgi:tetrahydromethanopterin S-methyltransferase subunit B
LTTALAVGGVFIILGLVVALTPNILQEANAFARDITNVTYPVGSGTANLPAPANPSAHIGLFTAVMYFFLGVGILQIIILPLRLWVKSPTRRIAETVGNLVFWLGGAAVANVYLLTGTLTGWFQFWIGLIFLVGLSLIARFIIYFSRRPSHLQRSAQPFTN